MVFLDGTTKLFKKLRELANDCSEYNWDGDNAVPIDKGAIERTMWFLSKLPKNIPLPELSPEPDGMICLDWIIKRNKSFSLSIGSEWIASFCFVAGDENSCGTVDLQNGQDLQNLFQLIMNITGTSPYVRD